ncbi:uncharacterized protein EV420DRAFT_1473421 [Desarmillaria tabescens]|uniref:Secreted protein n=1 Tax=Armillaria tabescens TaxID=1929756 RepID=A0AA39TYV6_ARMTA|nr:uncharacterized protein EV420DRAFT_1473421 [Desarmillaria tabescens]KAK0470368.1 hypothetical protein EV420DRAFT_1473421 [Desarmillaria tabescens]
MCFRWIDRAALALQRMFVFACLFRRGQGSSATELDCTYLAVAGIPSRLEKYFEVRTCPWTIECGTTPEEEKGPGVPGSETIVTSNSAADTLCLFVWFLTYINMPTMSCIPTDPINVARRDDTPPIEGLPNLDLDDRLKINENNPVFGDDW